MALADVASLAADGAGHGRRTREVRCRAGTQPAATPRPWRQCRTACSLDKGFTFLGCIHPVLVR